MKEQYNKNGFYVAKGLLRNDDIAKVIHSLDKVFVLQLYDKGAYDKEASLYENMKSLHDSNIESYKSALGVLSRLNSIHSLLRSDPIRDQLAEINIKESIIPTGPVVHVVSDSLAIPGGYFGQAAHQDWTSMQGSLDSVIVWVPLCDITKNFYNLEVIPGSHMNGLLEGEITDNQHTIDFSLYNEEDFTQVELCKGDVVFMSSWIIHRTSLNGPKDNMRIACSLRYENLMEETFIKRGYPSAYKRSVNREFITKNFPSLEQVKNIFK